jgi:hypothetical protein
MLVKHQTPQRMEIPHEAGNYFMLRPLGDAEVDDAEAAHATALSTRYSKETMDALMSLAGGGNNGEESELMKEVRTILAEERAAKAAAAAESAGESDGRSPAIDPLGSLDPATVVKFGLVSWDGSDYDAIPLTNEMRDDIGKELDRRTLRWAAREIAAMSVITEGEASSSGNGIGRSASLRSTTPTSRSGTDGNG